MGQKINFEEVRSWPVSRVLSRTAIHLGRPSPDASSNLPESGAGHAKGFLFGLAPGGVYTAMPVTGHAVRSYRTISPLPTRVLAVYFLLHFPWTHVPQALPGTLPCGARTFLCLFKRVLKNSGCPANSDARLKVKNLALKRIRARLFVEGRT